MDPAGHYVRRLIANQPAAAVPRTIGPPPVPPRPLVFPNDRDPLAVSRPLVTTLPNPGTGHGRDLEDRLNAWAEERAFWRSLP